MISHTSIVRLLTVGKVLEFIAVARFIAAVVIVLLLHLHSPVLHASTTVAGTTTVDSIFLVVDNNGNVVGSYPSEFNILFEYTKFFGEEFTNTSVEYRVLECTAGWWGMGIPSRTFYVPEIDGVIKIEGENVSGLCYASVENVVEGNTTRSSAGVVVKVSTKASIQIISLRTNTTTLPIGSYILQYVFGGWPPSMYYRVFVEKDIGGYKYYDLHQELLLVDFTSVTISTHIVEVWLNELRLRAYMERGSFNAGGVVLVPSYDVEICGKLSEAYGGKLSMIVSLSDREGVLEIPAGSMKCVNLSNTTLTPGANQIITLSVRSGAFSIALRYEGINVEGLVVSLSRPFGRVIASGSIWNALIQSLVTLTGYYSSFPTVVVKGSVSNVFFGSFECQTLTINQEGAYTLLCEKTIFGNFNWVDIENSNFRTYVEYIDERGGIWRYSAEVRLSVSDPSSIAGQVSLVYTYSMNVILMGVIVVILFYFISFVKEMITGTPLIDPHMLRGTLLTLVVTYAVLSVGIPTVYYTFGKIVENIPLLNKYITPITSTDPNVAFAHMISYYDQLFTAVMRDFEVEFSGSIGKIMSWLQSTTVFALGLMVVALALSTFWTPGAGIPFSSIASGIISLVFGIIGMLMMQVQMGVFALVAITISRVMVYVVTSVVLALMVLGVMLICLPIPTTQRIGEDLFGAGILYMIAFPLIAPLGYAMYMHLMDSIRVQGAIEAIGNICIMIPVPLCFIGFIPFITRMIAYVVASGVVTLLILGSLGYILSRTGVAAGIGEALSSLVWRG